MRDNRDYADLRRTDIAVYSFRGYTVLKFDKESKQLSIGKYADMCCFVESDLKYMSRFLEQCYLYSTGVCDNIDHVSVD